MTVRRIIEKTDRLFPNIFPFSVKAMWLQELDKRILSDLLTKYEDFPVREISFYDEEPESVLLVPEEYSELYTRFLAMQFDIVSGDTARYQNSSALYNGAYLSFMNSVNRKNTHKPVYIIIE